MWKLKNSQFWKIFSNMNHFNNMRRYCCYSSSWLTTAHSPSVMTWTLATAVFPGPGLHSYLSALSFMMVPTSRLVTNVPLLSGSNSIPEFSPPMNLAIWILFVFGIWYWHCPILPCHPVSILNSWVWYQLCTLCMSALTWTQYSHRYQVLHLLLL